MAADKGALFEGYGIPSRMAHPVETYWDALANKAATTMASCYAPGATFQDPVFNLQGVGIGKMRQNLFGSASDLQIQTDPLTVDGNKATGTWHASYTCTMAGRMVHYTNHSTFEAQDGVIVAQQDHFNLWKWTRMALGSNGKVLGCTPLVRKKVRTMATKRLK